MASSSTSERLLPTHNVGLHEIANATRSSSWNAEARTFEFVLATENPVRTYRRDEDWNRIEVDEQIVIAGIQDIDKLRGQPILDSHQRWSTDTVVGVIESARIEGSQLICVGRLADVPSVSEIAVKVATGILTNVSVGFEIIAEERSTRAGQIDLVRITSWRAHEASIVAVPADRNANIRSLQEETNMTDKPVPALTAADIAAAVRSAVSEELTARGVKAPEQPQQQEQKPADPTAERTTQLVALRAAAERRGLAEDFDALANSGETVENLRGMLRSALETRSEETNGTDTPKDGVNKPVLRTWAESNIGKRSAAAAAARN